MKIFLFFLIILICALKVTIGMPPFNEHTISTPLPEGELRQVIHDAYGDDESTAMLTQVNVIKLQSLITNIDVVNFCMITFRNF